MKKMLTLCACLFSIFGGCAQNQSKVKKISGEEAQKMLDAGNVILVDVRTNEEYNEGHIPNAVLLPDFEISSRAAHVLPDKNAAIIVYCRSGARSARAAAALAEMGYTRIYDLGGIISWKGKVVR